MSLSFSSGVAWARKSSTPGFRGDRRRGHGIVAGDHDGADAHAAKLGEALADAALDDVLEMDDAEQLSVLGDGERRAARFGDALGDGIDLAHQSQR